jgi:hypothetical protein
MKNVTIALDDETHRNARIRAAELGTSLSALVKQYLEGLGNASPLIHGLREMPMQYAAPPAQTPPSQTPPSQAEGPPWLIDGKWVYTKDGKPRQPGAMRGAISLSEDFDAWPDDILASFEAWDYDDNAKPK